jgi:hypothetical protein
MSDTGQTPQGGMLETGQAPLVNIALGKPALQSSIDVFSVIQDPAGDARGAVSGTVTGGYGFHTGHEEGPWWQVDLEVPSVVRELVVFNRGDQDELLARALPLEIAFSDDGLDFRRMHVQEAVFGGRDGTPMRWSLPGSEITRFVRLSVPRSTCLHLDEVEVYGAPVGPSAAETAGGGMGQASALGVADEAPVGLPRHEEEVAKADLLPPPVMAPSATADQGVDIVGNDPPRELGEAEVARTPFWQDAVTAAPVTPAAPAAAPAPAPQADGFLAKLRRALFGE